MATIDGGAGDDLLVGTPGADLIRGYAGEDALFGEAGDDTLEGGADNDALQGGADDDLMSGGDGDDFVWGEAGDDTVSGGGGDDHLRGGAGLDQFDGGAGFDRVSFFHMDATQGVVASLATQTIYNDGYGNTESLTSIEGLGSGTRFTDVFIGDADRNLLLVGRDVALAGGGDDDIQLEEAPLFLDGGAGTDTILRFISQRLIDTNGDGVAEFVPTSSGVVVDLSRNLIVEDGFGGSGAVWNVENVGGSAYDDVLIGDRGDNVLAGHGGDDELTGGRGDDVFLFVGGELGGTDTVTDFQNGRDRFEFRGVPGVDDYADLVITDIGRDVRVTWGDGSASLIIENTPLGRIDPSDFLFT